MKKRTSSHLLVLGQLGCVALCCYPQGWRNLGSAWWLLFCLAGALLGVTSLYYNRPGNFSVYPELLQRAKLITDGPYRLMRHPMYTALMLMMIGVTAFNSHWINFLAAIGLVAIVTTKATREERILTSAFVEYSSYAGATKRFVPYIY